MFSFVGNKCPTCETGLPEHAQFCKKCGLSVRSNKGTSPHVPSRNADGFMGLVMFIAQLLDETFKIYFRHFWRFIKLTAPIQMAAGVSSILVLDVFSGDMLAEAVAFSIAAFVGIFGFVFLFGVGTTAVSQHYLTGSIGMQSCYQRAWWKIVSLAIISIITVLVMGVVLVTTLTPTKTWMAAASMIVLIPTLTLLIYWSVAVQVVMVEGRKHLDALRRSAQLIRGNWLRIFCVTVILGLITLGLRIVATIPFVALVSLALGSVPMSNPTNSILELGGVIVGVIVSPILFIGITLAYYDLRVRKENFDLSILSQEMAKMRLYKA